jgi:ribose 5-phosphate isomerase RpiB
MSPIEVFISTTGPGSEAALTGWTVLASFISVGMSFDETRLPGPVCAITGREMTANNAKASNLVKLLFILS